MTILEDEEIVQDLKDMLSSYLRQFRQLQQVTNTTLILQEKKPLINGVWAASSDAIAYPSLYPLISELYDVIHYPIHTLGLWNQIKKYYGEIGLKVAIDSEQFRHAGRFLTYIGVINASQDNPSVALNYFQQAVDFFEKLPEDTKAREDLAATLFHICATLNNLGLYAEVIKNAALTISVCQETGRWDTEAFALGQIGNAYVRMGDLKNAELMYLKTAKIWENHPEKIFFRHITFYHLGRVNLVKGNYHEAQKYLEQSIEIKKQVGQLKEGLAHCAIYLGITYIKLGKLNEAQSNFDMANRIVREELYDIRAMAELRYGYALIAIQQRKYEDAKMLLHDSLDKLGRNRFPDVKLQIALCLLKLALQRFDIKSLIYAIGNIHEVRADSPQLRISSIRILFKV